MKRRQIKILPKSKDGDIEIGEILDERYVSDTAEILQAIAVEVDNQSFAIPMTKTSLVLVGQMTFNGSITGPPTDSIGLEYTEIPGSHASGAGTPYHTDVAWYQAIVPDAKDGSPNHVQGHFSEEPGSYPRLVIMEVIGDLDVAVSTYGTDSGGPQGNNAGTLTPSKDNALIVGMWTANGDGGWSPDSGWTMLIADTAGGGGTGIGYKTQDKAGPFEAALTTGNTDTQYSSSAVAVVPRYVIPQ